MIEVRPYGVKCNIRCTYCYQENERNHVGTMPKVDLNSLRDKIKNLDQPFSLFGGEPLLMPIDQIEKLFEWGYKRFGENHIQTNGVLVNDKHISIFKKFNVKVGISVDGPLALNKERWAGSIERTDDTSKKTHSAIERLCQQGIPPSIILTLHKKNASSHLLDELSDWILYLELIGVKKVRLHLLEVDSPEALEKLALSKEESINSLLHFYQLEQKSLKSLSFDIFQEIELLLQSDDGQTGCVWHACDPLTTPAVQGLEGNGSLSNCGRTNKDGVGFIKNKEPGYDRYISLYQTPQFENGCKDCRFFLICKGQCPGTSINGDWRNRSEHCEIWMKVFEIIEEKLLKKGLLPISQHPNRVQLEKLCLSQWLEQKNMLLKDIIKDTQHQQNQFQKLNMDERFVNPSSLRLSWTSIEAQKEYEFMLNSLVHFCNGIKLEAVAKGFVESASIKVSADELDNYVQRAKRLELILDVIGVTNCVFSKQNTAVNQIELDVQVRKLESPQNNNYINKTGSFFTCIQYTKNNIGEYTNYDDPLFNVLLAPIGLSLFAWDYRNQLNDQFSLYKELIVNNEHTEDLGKLRSILSWPMEFTCLHGIAECKTPVFKFTFGTDYTSDLITVNHLGKLWPSKGALGLRFPYRNRYKRD